MIKTDELVKAPSTTMFFNRITVTYEEFENLYQYGQISPWWLKMVVINYDDFTDIASTKRTMTTTMLYQHLVVLWSTRVEEVKQDVRTFACGEIDLLDMVVKYSMNHKKCRQFVKDVLYTAGCDMDVDSYWKQHKKHKQKETTIAVYGVTHSALVPEVQAKRIATNRKKYGADNPMQTSEIKEKLRKKVHEKYGVDYTFQKSSEIPQWYKKLFDTLMRDDAWKTILSGVANKHNVELTYELFDVVLPVNRRDFVISELSNTHVEDLLRLWNTETKTVMEFPTNALFKLPFMFSKTWLMYYEKLGILKVPKRYYEVRSSIYEKHMRDVLDDIGIPYMVNHRKALDGVEMDFYIPEKKIGIELNPNVSHNSNLYATEAKRSMFNSHKASTYHYDKYMFAQHAGITLIQLFGNDLVEPVFSEVTIKRLKTLLVGCDDKYYARHVQVIKATSIKDKKMARAFMDMYHSQGSSRAKEYWLFQYGDKLLGSASFSLKSTSKSKIELKRLCFKPDTQIVGGLSKLIAHYFREHHDCQQVYSYSDNNLGSGNGYRKAGATFVRETGPSLKFISPRDERDVYSWQIATPWGADNGVVGNDAKDHDIEKPATRDAIDEYIETRLHHRSDDGVGYDRIYTAGSKLWMFERKE